MQSHGIPLLPFFAALPQCEKGFFVLLDVQTLQRQPRIPAMKGETPGRIVFDVRPGYLLSQRVYRCN